MKRKATLPFPSMCMDLEGPQLMRFPISTFLHPL